MNCNWTDGDFELKLLAALELIYSDADRLKRALRNKNGICAAHFLLLPSGIAYLWQCTFPTSKLPIFFVWIPFELQDPGPTVRRSFRKPLLLYLLSSTLFQCRNVSVDSRLFYRRRYTQASQNQKRRDRKSDKKLTDKTLIYI